jgi:hypothetical protein
VAPEALGTPAADEAAPDAEDACRPGLTRRADGTCGPAPRPTAARKAAAAKSEPAKAATGPDRAAEGCPAGDAADPACTAPAPAASEAAPARGTCG